MNDGKLLCKIIFFFFVCLFVFTYYLISNIDLEFFYLLVVFVYSSCYFCFVLFSTNFKNRRTNKTKEREKNNEDNTHQIKRYIE